MHTMNHKELTDCQLLAYLDGEADVAALIEQQPEQQTRVKEWADLQNCLRARLRPLKRPSSIELGEYQMGLLPAEKVAEVEQYLADFPYARCELDLLDAFLDEPDFPKPAPVAPAPALGIMSTLRILVAKLTQAGQGGLGLAPMGVRDGGSLQLDTHRLEEGVYEVDDILVSINVEEDESQPGCRALFGYVDAETPLSEALLWRSNQPEMRAKVSVDEDGDFLISGLERGRYELILVGPEIEVHIPDLIF